MPSGPSTLKKLKELTYRRPNIADIFHRFDYLEYADDRVTAIILSSDLEDKLEDIIICRMVKLTKAERDGLFRGDGPLATFSAKIKLAYSLGIFGRKTRRDLDIIRLIRNAFAHGRKAIWFHTEEIAKACALITAPDRLPDSTQHTQTDPKLRYREGVYLIERAFAEILWPGITKEHGETVPLD